MYYILYIYIIPNAHRSLVPFRHVPAPGPSHLRPRNWMHTHERSGTELGARKCRYKVVFLSLFISFLFPWIPLAFPFMSLSFHFKSLSFLLHFPFISLHVPFISLSLPFRFFLFHTFHETFPPLFPFHLSFVSFHFPSFAVLFPFISLSWPFISLFNSFHCRFINFLDFIFVSLLFHFLSSPFIIFHVSTYLRLYWMYLYIHIYIYISTYKDR